MRARRLAVALTLAAITAAGMPASAAQPSSDVATVAAPPTIAEVRIHGNHTTPDADVRRLAGLAEGQAADAAVLEEARQRLLASGRFVSVEIRTRYRSLTDTTQVAVLVLITEDALVSVTDAGDVLLPGPLARVRRNTMFLPILGFEDGYGLTYGVRLTVVGSRRSATRVSAPLSWGGTRQAAVEASHTFARGPISRVSGRAGVTRREHPFFREGEKRTGISGEVLKRFGPIVGLGVTAARTDVGLGDVEGRLDALGVFVELDTRADPVFPRNAVYVRSGITRLGLAPAPASLQTSHDARGYLGLWRGTVLATRLQASRSDGPLPVYAKPMVGGAASLRGWRAGTSIGDHMIAASGDLRVPLTSPVNLARIGLTVFYDAATTWDHGTRLKDQRLHRGAGIGLFVAAPVFSLQLDVARGIGRGTRVHLSTGISF